MKSLQWPKSTLKSFLRAQLELNTVDAHKSCFHQAGVLLCGSCVLCMFGLYHDQPLLTRNCLTGFGIEVPQADIERDDAGFAWHIGSRWA
jgi:hypothetical protein